MNRVFALWGLLAAPLLIGPTVAAEKAAIPDFTGAWARNAFNMEAPASGPGPLANLRRVGKDATAYILGGDPVPLVGDYKNPILKPQAAEAVKRWGEHSASGHDIPDPSNQCHPFSPPFLLGMEQVVRIAPLKNEVVMYYSQDDQVRHIHLNASHPARLTPSAMGHSVGHYEGDTLVVDTVGIKVGPYTTVDRFGTPQSEAMHVVERYRLIDAEEARKAQERHELTAGRVGGKEGNNPIDASYGKGLQVQVRIDDPNVFTAPWSAIVTYRRTPMAWDERVCAENNYSPFDPEFAHVPTAARPDF